MSGLIWNDPELLRDYKKASPLPGLYVIGRFSDSFQYLASSALDDPYLGANWPNGFIPEYVGISESRTRGVKQRLSCHARTKGSKRIASLLDTGVDLFFIVAYGEEFAKFEPIYIALRMPGQFDCNIRDENIRSSRKQYREIRADMSQFERDFYDRIDSEYDGM